MLVWDSTKCSFKVDLTPTLVPRWSNLEPGTPSWSQNEPKTLRLEAKMLPRPPNWSQADPKTHHLELRLPFFLLEHPQPHTLQPRAPRAEETVVAPEFMHRVAQCSRGSAADSRSSSKDPVPHGKPPRSG
eukprot:195831-Karenia_brevis.AAC.1